VSDSAELIRVEKVSFSYDHVLVLDQVDLSIARGDFLAVLGPNGSGKTTLVKIILGLYRPTKGKVWLMGKPLEEFEDWEKVGYVPQKATHIDPVFPASVKEVVAMALRPRSRRIRLKRRQEETAVDKALERVGMGEYKNRPIGSLSGGQQQRVIIARAIVNGPELLFLDEPTAGVDAAAQEVFYELLHRLNKEEQMTIVLITHDIGIVTKHVNRVACLSQRLVYHGDHADFCLSETFRDMLDKGHLVSHSH
jgi:zinc transport system ATP-binding protein